MEGNAQLITGDNYRRMITAAYQAFKQQFEYINSLNVYPVPDGDTGTNMLLTMEAAVKVFAAGSESGIGELSKQVSNSAIMGARGNSGVILSQILRGIARGLTGKKAANSAEIGKAFQYGVLYAYRSVARPVEGTILTVAKGIAKGAHHAVRNNVLFTEMLEEAIRGGQKELARTPELLPVLKQAGVVDAGGQGLLVFLKGCLDGLTGKAAAYEPLSFQSSSAFDDTEWNKSFPYCTTYVVKNFTANLDEVRTYLNSVGESLVIAEGDGFIKVHIHAANPGAVLDKAITWGTLHDIKIENMADQQEQRQKTAPSKTGTAVISVVSGNGLTEMMQKLGASIIISGGQTMNPPVEAFVEAVKAGDKARYIILPNNKNIVMAALQAKKILGDIVDVVPTVNVPQGFAALMAFNPEESLENNITNMTERFSAVKAAAVTTAVRDSVQDGQNVAAGTLIGVVDGKVKVAAENLETVLASVTELLVTPDNEVVSLYYGEDLSQEAAESLAEKLADAFPEIAVETYYGGQPIYHFLVSVE